MNFHGGGDGFYTPIESREDVQSLRPLYFGMQFAGKLAGFEIAQCNLPENVNASAYFATCQNASCIAVVNKSAERLVVTLDPALAKAKPSTCEVLSAPALTAREGVSLRLVRARASRDITVEPFTALLYRWNG